MPLLFMGGEFAQVDEWNHNRSLDWHLADLPNHKGVQLLLRDPNALYRETTSLHYFDGGQSGFQWIDASDHEQSCLSFMRRGPAPADIAVIVCNFTPVPRMNYRVGVPLPGRYDERINTDAAAYGGTNLGNDGFRASDPIPWHGQAHSIALTLPPLATLIVVYCGS
jgi:1,4-alpha-glucan branching enzyme